MIQLDINPTKEQAALATLVIQPLTADRIKVTQENDLKLQELMEKANRGNDPGFTNDDLLRTADVKLSDQMMQS